MDGGQVFGGNGEIVISRQHHRRVAKLLVDAKDRIEIFKTAIDDIAQRYHEGQFLAIEGVDRFAKLFGLSA